MTKHLPLICFALVAVLALALTAFVISRFGFVGALACAGVAIAGWAVSTWYFRDDTPLFAPWTPGRVTFVEVLQGFFRDVAEIARPVWTRLWLNLPFVAVMAVDAVAMMTPELRHSLFLDAPIGGAALVVLTLLARYGSTPAHPPIARA